MPVAEPGVVIDASGMLKLLLPEEGSEAVHGLWREWIERDVAAFLGQELSLLHPHGIEETAWALADATGWRLWTSDRRFAVSLRRKAARIRLV